MRRRRYIPVAARCEALKVYRMRRQGLIGEPPMGPVDAARDTVAFFAGHYAAAVLYGDTDRAARLFAGFRAALAYQKRVYGARWSW